MGGIQRRAESSCQSYHTLYRVSKGEESVEIIVKGEPKEIAALLWEITERQKKDIAKEVSKDLAKSFAESAKAASIHFRAYVDTPR